jgi:hypothetical protein
MHNSGEIAPRECFWLFENGIVLYPRRPGLTTNVRVALCWSGNPGHKQHRWLWVPAFRGDDELMTAYRPVFTLVHSRLMTRWVAGSRAVMMNSFAIVASSG